MDKLLLFNEETERLKFRKLVDSDFDSWKPLFYEKDAAVFLGMDPKLDVDELCKAWFTKCNWRYDNLKGGMNVLIHKESGELIGQTGLLIQEVDGKEMIEIGYSILPKFWGQGYASEAAVKCKEYAFKNELANELVSIIHPDNHGSAKVAMNNGMKLFKSIENYKEMPVNIFRIKK